MTRRNIYGSRCENTFYFCHLHERGVSHKLENEIFELSSATRVMNTSINESQTSSFFFAVAVSARGFALHTIEKITENTKR